jgi:hypothetical protein
VEYRDQLKSEGSMIWPFSAIRRAIHNRDRRIFRFWDGRKWTSIDPMIPFRILAQHKDFDWEETPKLIAMPDKKVWLEAYQLEVSAVREAFGVRPFNDDGLTEAECIDLLVAFSIWQVDVKKNSSMPPISAESTAQRESAIMKHGSASSST